MQLYINKCIPLGDKIVCASASNCCAVPCWFFTNFRFFFFMSYCSSSCCSISQLDTPEVTGICDCTLTNALHWVRRLYERVTVYNHSAKRTATHRLWRISLRFWRVDTAMQGAECSWRQSWRICSAHTTFEYCLSILVTVLPQPNARWSAGLDVLNISSSTDDLKPTTVY